MTLPTDALGKLSAEQIEALRKSLLSSDWCGYSKARTVHALCDMALASLSETLADPAAEYERTHHAYFTKEGARLFNAARSEKQHGDTAKRMVVKESARELRAEADRLERENVYSAQGITRDWLRYVDDALDPLPDGNEENR